MPIYHVKSPDGERIIEANTPAGAIAHVARNTITAKNLTASDLLYLMQRGLSVETAKAEAAEPAAAKPAEEEKTNG